MSKNGLILALAIALLLVGCKQSSQVTYTPPALAEEWTISMTQSGGIMGLLRTVTVKSDGNYTVIDERAAKKITGKLTEEKFDELQELISGLEFTAPQMPTVCADCFVFDVEIQSSGKKMIIQADDISLPDSGMQPLVDLLRELMDSALK